MRWPWWNKGRFTTPGPAATPRRKELETRPRRSWPRIFGALPSDVEEMIRLRLEERSWSAYGRWLAGEVLQG